MRWSSEISMRSWKSSRRSAVKFLGSSPPWEKRRKHLGCLSLSLKRLSTWTGLPNLNCNRHNKPTRSSDRILFIHIRLILKRRKLSWPDSRNEESSSKRSTKSIWFSLNSRFKMHSRIHRYSHQSRNKKSRRLSLRFSSRTQSSSRRPKPR